MSAKNGCLVTEGAREEFIDKEILSLSKGSRSDISRLVEQFGSADIHALSVLAYAAKAEKLDEYLHKFKGYLETQGQFDHPLMRGVKAERFMMDCYKSLRVHPTH